MSADAGLLAFDVEKFSDNVDADTPPNDNPGQDFDPNDKENENGHPTPQNNLLPAPRESAHHPLQRKGSQYKDYNNVAHTNDLPISFSVAVNRSLSNTLSVETGLTYTYLHSTFESYPSMSNCHWHYLGIPLKLNLRLCNIHHISMYMTSGAILDIPLYSKAEVHTLGNSLRNDYPTLREGRFHSPVIWSLSASCGLSIKLEKRLDVFLEPTLLYNFDHNVTVPNVWSDDRWGFSLPIGLRFTL